MYVQFRKDASAIYPIFSLIIVVYITSTCSSVHCSFSIKTLKKPEEARSSQVTGHTIFHRKYVHVQP